MSLRQEDEIELMDEDGSSDRLRAWKNPDGTFGFRTIEGNESALVNLSPPDAARLKEWLP